MMALSEVPYRLFFLLILLRYASSQSTPFVQSTPCPVVLPTTRIVGGTSIKASTEAPYMVYLRTAEVTCTGTLVAPTKVITAAHCGVTANATAFLFSTEGANGIEIPVRSNATHPTEDIALVTLSRRANVEPARILTNPDLPSPWSFVRAQGYGRQSFFPFPSDKRLRFVDLPVISPEHCRELLGDRVGLSDPSFQRNILCTGYPESASCSPCQGDSGGPLLAFLDNKPVLLGVVSRGSACGFPDQPGFSIRITGMIGWLDVLRVRYTGVSELDEAFVDRDSNESNTTKGPIFKTVTVETGLSSGVIAGIVVACITAALVAVLAVVFGVRWKRKRSDLAGSGDTNVGTVADEEGGENGIKLTEGGASLMPEEAAPMTETGTGEQKTQVD